MQVRESLRFGETNIRIMAGQLARWRALCKAKTGRNQYKHTLAGYGGLSIPRRSVWCGQIKIRGKWRDLSPKRDRWLSKSQRRTLRRIQLIEAHRRKLIKRLRSRSR